MNLDYEADLADKLAKNVRVWEMLAPHAEAGSQFELDFFFYADSKEGSERVVGELRSLGYQVETKRRGTVFNRVWAITGSTPAMALTGPGVDAWTRRMVDVARLGDAQFDGWGTALPA